MWNLTCNDYGRLLPNYIFILVRRTMAVDDKKQEVEEDKREEMVKPRRNHLIQLPQLMLPTGQNSSENEKRADKLMNQIEYLACALQYTVEDLLKAHLLVHPQQNRENEEYNWLVESLSDMHGVWLLFNNHLKNHRKTFHLNEDKIDKAKRALTKLIDVYARISARAPNALTHD